MQRLFLLLFLMLCAITSYCQSQLKDSLINASIDKAIHQYTSEKPKLLFIRNGEVAIDSSFFRKVNYSVNKKEVHITLQDHSHKTVDTAEFWGTQTDFGQWRRFYHGKEYIVWHASSPYVYRDYAASDRKIKYFYSKSLVSEIVPLTKKNVYEIADSNAIAQLKSYLKTHDIEKSKDRGLSIDGPTAIDEGNLLFDFIEMHIRLAWAIIEIAELVETIK